MIMNVKLLKKKHLLSASSTKKTILGAAISTLTVTIKRPKTFNSL